MRGNASRSVSRVNLLAAFLVGALLFVARYGCAQSPSDPWLVLANGKRTSITAHTTRLDLVHMYGAANVVDEDVDIGEGEMQSATFLFPKDPERQIEILWKDPDAKTVPKSADIEGKKSRWHAVHGISLGTSSTELEHINGRPFRWTLKNDGTDMAEELISWRGGSLEKEFQGGRRVILELEMTPSKGSKAKGPQDVDTNSDNPAWRTQNPRVSRMTWFFPPNTQP